MSTPTGDPSFEALLNYLKRNRGFDFTGYKRPSLMRLMKKRMSKVEIDSFSEYLDYLEANPLEMANLFDALLLNVTAFFRDASAWSCLSQEIIPSILSTKPGKEPIRIWSAGCATGEEAYTLAMVFAEALGIEAFRSRVKIYATDLDEAALSKGRQATYTIQELRNLPENLVEKYFEVIENRYIFRAEPRRCVIFGRHDLVRNAPISHLDLLVCRNTLMYFNSETQARILSRFHFALDDTGFLFVGKAEMLLTYTMLFTPVNLKYRIFSKVPKANNRQHLLGMLEADNIEDTNWVIGTTMLREQAFEFQSIAQIVVDSQGNLVLANHLARSLFELTVHDLGRPLQDLEVSYRPTELRSHIQQAYAEGTTVKIFHVELTRLDASSLFLDIEVTPLFHLNNTELGVCIDFKDVTRYNQLQLELQRSTQELETVHEELQSTNEELKTTNEELQSTNEELETMNEELQSSNEELQTTNDELRQRTEELNRVNAFMNSILASLRVAMIVLSHRLSIQLWNDRAEELWGLRTDEVYGYFFFDLDIGLPLDLLRQPIHACQMGTSDCEEVILNAINRRGRQIRCRVICTPLILGNDCQGIILLMEERPLDRG